jgi:hypothetical protein
MSISFSFALDGVVFYPPWARLPENSDHHKIENFDHVAFRSKHRDFGGSRLTLRNYRFGSSLAIFRF